MHEYVNAEGAVAETEQAGWGGKRLVTNAQNCIHCKFCNVKVLT